MSHGSYCAREKEALPESFNHRVTLYSMAAATAGVGLLALSPSVEASVVITKANITIAAGTPVYIDLNKDGIKDFAFSLARGGYDHSVYATLAVKPLTGGRVAGGNRGSLGPYASALAKGANIGPSAHFSSSPGRGQLTIERSNGAVSGPTFSTYKLYGKWSGVTNGYLGVKFLIKGQIHYGWIRMNVTKTSGTITEYAYETTANKKIVTSAFVSPPESESAEDSAKPKVPSLGMLAMGAEGLSIWRRD